MRDHPLDLELQTVRAQDPAWALLRLAALVGAGYFAGAHIGLSLVPKALPVSVLWLPSAVLLAALVLTPPRWWWAAIAGAFPAHLIADLQAGLQLPVVLGYFASNVLEAVTGALVMHRLSDSRGLSSLREVIVFSCAAVVAAFLSALADAGMLLVARPGSGDFAQLWQAHFFSDLLAITIVVPVIATWSALKPMSLRQEARERLFEIAAMVAGLFAAGVIAFDSVATPNAGPPALLYLPVPFLVWAALRFGPAITSGATAIVAFLVVWGAMHGRGPFHAISVQLDPLPLQLFLVSIALPLLILAALVEERRDAEARLRASQELFSRAFRGGPDAIAISRRRDGSIVEANDRWLELLGYAPGTAAHAVAPLHQHVDEGNLRRLHALAASPGGRRDMEMNLRDRQGSMHAVLIGMSAVDVAGEACDVTMLRDITQQRQAETDAREQRRQLTHLTRVASLSDFSSTIAHELNQPLTAILANAQAALRFLQRDPPNVGEIRAILDEIADADKRAGLLIHHLRLLMKKGEEEFVQVDINHLVHDVLEFIQGEFLLRGVEVKNTFGHDLPQVQGDRVQLQQLVLNLVCNACDAMQGQPEQRVLAISTSHRPEGGVEVAVSDTGHGIPPDRLERVFEAFYTTKQSGLGMGLAICRRIAAAHGGALSAQNRPGEGATFRLVLPSVQPVSRAERDADQRGFGSRSTTTAS